MEIRLRTLDVECRDDGSFKIGGYVNVTERESELLYSNKRNKWFNEVVKQGAFTRSLKSGKNIPLLLEHDYDKKLADTTSGLTLTEDQIGLRFDAEIRDKDVYEKIKSKQINNCSFGFLPIDEDFEEVGAHREKRYLKNLELLEVSLVENPAYAGSLVEVRNMNAKIEKDKEKESTEDKKEVEDEEINIEENKKEEVESKEEKSEVDEVAKNEDSEIEDDSEKRDIIISEPINNIDTVETKVEDIVGKQETQEEIINEIVKEKEIQLENAELDEALCKQDLEFVKNMHKDEEEFLEKELLRRSAQVIKLRVQLLKLKNI